MGMSSNATSNVTKFQGGYSYNIDAATDGALLNSNSGINLYFTQKFKYELDG